MSITNHFHICACFKSDNEVRTNNETHFIEVKYRNYSENNINEFKQDIDEVDCSSILNFTDPNVSCENFSLLFNSVFDTNFPLKPRKTKKKYISKNFLNDEIKTLIKERNKPQRKFYRKPLTYGDQ